MALALAVAPEAAVEVALEVGVVLEAVAVHKLGKDNS